MKRFFHLPLIFLCSCSVMPEIAKDFEDVVTDNAVRVEIQKEALQKDSIIDVNIKINHQP